MKILLNFYAERVSIWKYDLNSVGSIQICFGPVRNDFAFG